MKRVLVFFFTALLLSSISNAQNLGDRKGYQGNVELELGYVTGTNAFDAAVLTTHGYNTGSCWFFGAGTGLRVTPNHYALFSVPVFADVRYSFCNNQVRPFVDMKVGTEINLEELTAGLYISPSVGIMINRYAISIKYGFNSGATDLVQGPLYQRYDYNAHTISVGLAVAF